MQIKRFHDKYSNASVSILTCKKIIRLSSGLQENKHEQIIVGNGAVSWKMLGLSTT
jgi:hypothetical protein